MAGELDAKVHEAMGGTAVGEAGCWYVDGSAGDVHRWADEEASSWDTIRPVYVDVCACEWYATDPLARQWAPYETKRFGHYKQCLAVVPRYSEEWVDVRQVEDWIAQQEGALWARYVQALCSVFLEDNVESRGDGDEALWWDFIRATPEQRCRAFLLAMEKRTE